MKHILQNMVVGEVLELDILTTTATQARTMQLFYHDAHNETSGPNFHEDHEFFGQAYKELTDQYDVLAEELVKRGQSVQPLKHAIDKVEISSGAWYRTALDMENRWQDRLNALNKSAPLGLQDALGTFASSSDVRIYKIQQKLK